MVLAASSANAYAQMSLARGDLVQNIHKDPTYVPSTISGTPTNDVRCGCPTTSGCSASSEPQIGLIITGMGR